MSINEKIISEIWKEGKFKKELTVDDSQKIEIIDPGTHNKDSAGPDFLNARIKFGNITYLGDIEIDTWHNDWKTHGHFFDKKYNKVILHITISRDKHQPFVFCNDGRKVHSICLIDFVDEIGILYACSPKASLTALVSDKSFKTVAVPWALIYPT